MNLSVEYGLFLVEEFCSLNRMSWTPYEVNMASKIKKNGRVRWVGRVQKQGVIRQKLLDIKAEALAWEAEERKRDWSQTDTDCSLIDWANAYLDYAKRFSKTVYSRKRAAFKFFFSAHKGKRKIINPETSVKELTRAKVLEALEIQKEARTGNAANADRKELVAAWNWGIKYLDLPQLNPCVVEKFAETRHPRYVPPLEETREALDAFAKRLSRKLTANKNDETPVAKV